MTFYDFMTVWKPCLLKIIAGDKAKQVWTTTLSQRNFTFSCD